MFRHKDKYVNVLPWRFLLEKMGADEPEARAIFFL